MSGQDMIVDKKGRRFRNLRISLTAACNYACGYCVEDGKRLLKASNELQADQLVSAVEYLIESAGIEKLRITGGEPLITPKFDEFLPSVTRLPLKDLSLTTNGQFLKQKSRLIADSGIERVNVSLDTLHPLRFRQIARSGDVKSVLAGIDAMLEQGIRVKVNTVPMKTRNRQDLLPLLNYCLALGIELRFIELMRMGHLNSGNGFYRDFMSMNEVLELIGSEYEFERTGAPYDSTAVRYRIPGKGVFGVIANESEPFCSSCTRLRLSADGYLYGCLSSSNRHFIGDLLRKPRHLALPALQRILVGALADKQDYSFQGEVTVMKLIGG